MKLSWFRDEFRVEIHALRDDERRCILGMSIGHHLLQPSITIVESNARQLVADSLQLPEANTDYAAVLRVEGGEQLQELAMFITDSVVTFETDNQAA